jgi:uncharacterized membrane protein
MRGTIASAARTEIVKIGCVALLGLASGVRLQAADLKFTHIDYPNALEIDQGANFNHPNTHAQRHDYRRGDVPGALSSKRHKLRAYSSARRGQYNYTQVDVPGAVSTGLYGINSNGQTVGSYDDLSGTTHGFVRNVYGSIVTIDYPGATFTTANWINSQGDVVGRWDDANRIAHTFLRTSQGTITSFDPPAPCVPNTLEPPTTAHGINDRGDIVGRCYDASGKELGWLLRHDGSFTTLDDPGFLTADGWAIDNSRVVVGDYSDTDGFVHGFSWTESDGFTTLDFKNYMTGLRAINQHGDISGIYFDGLTLHGFLRLKNGTGFTIDPPGSVETDSVVVNNGGLIAGTYYDGDFNAHGYIAIVAATAARGINKKVEVVARATQCQGLVWPKSQFCLIDLPSATSRVALGSATVAGLLADSSNSSGSKMNSRGYL